MMKLIFILCLSVFLVLAGCNSDDKVSTKSQKTKTDIDSKKWKIIKTKEIVKKTQINRRFIYQINKDWH